MIDGRTVPPGWAVRPLAQCVEVLDYLRKPVNSKERSHRTGTVPYYGATGQVGWIDDHIFDEELVLVGEDGAPFLDKSKPIAYLIAGKSWVNNHAHVLRARREITSNQYIKFYLDAFDFTTFVQGSTRDKLTQQAMNSIPVLLPPLPIQAALVSRLQVIARSGQEIGDQLAGARRGLEAFRQAVLTKACIGEFVDRRAERADTVALTGVELVRALRAKCRNPVTAAHERPPDRQIPSGWTWARLGEIAESIEYGYTAASTREPIGPRLLRITDIQNDSVDWTSTPFCQIDQTALEKYQLHSGDLLFARTGATTGKSYLLRGEPPLAVFASYLIRVRLTTSMDPDFVYAFFRSGLYWRQIAEASVGTGQPNVNGTRLANLWLPVPGLSEQQMIARQLNSLLDQTTALAAIIESAGRKLERAPRAALASAFRGELILDGAGMRHA